MDLGPDDILSMAREYALEAKEYTEDNDGQMDCENVASALDAYADLDEWVSNGGALPQAWNKGFTMTHNQEHNAVNQEHINAVNQKLIDELKCVLVEIDLAISVVKQEAKERGVSHFDMRLVDGSWTLTPLLTAKAQVLSSIALFEPKS